MFAPSVGGLQQTTNYKIVLPFYAYASLAFLVAAVLLFFNTDLIVANYINPKALALTHTMALAWGTMIIFGASYQLLPVLIEGKLKSEKLAYLTFVFSGIGIPILIYGFYVFDFHYLMPLGAILVNLGILSYFINVLLSAFESKKQNVHAWFIITASLWLLSTTIFGMLLVFNLEYQFLMKDSWSYLSIHAHLGIVGWFLLLVIGVGSRLIPMFLISKYENKKALWRIFALINGGLLAFIVLQLIHLDGMYLFLPIFLILGGVANFVYFILQARKVRIRRRVDNQVKTSIFSVIQMLLPILVLVIIVLFLPTKTNLNVTMLYGFTIFFGWITAIILGMTYKTLPFIVWNKVYDSKARRGKTLTPKDLFSEKMYDVGMIAYLIGFFIFILGVIIVNSFLLKLGAAGLVVSAALYFINTSKTILHKTK